MKKAFHALALTTALTLAGFTVVEAENIRQQSGTSSAASYITPGGCTITPLGCVSTCWVKCLSLQTGVTKYTIPNVTQDECCSGAVWSCPPGSAPAHPSWGEPAATCPINEM